MRDGIHWSHSCGSISSGDEEMCGKGFLFKANIPARKERKCNMCVSREKMKAPACKGSKQMSGWSQVAVTAC